MLAQGGRQDNQRGNCIRKNREGEEDRKEGINSRSVHMSLQRATRQRGLVPKMR